jgi:hypothetical protein
MEEYLMDKKHVTEVSGLRDDPDGRRVDGISYRIFKTAK